MTDNLNITIGKRLKKVRDTLGFTQKEVSDMMGFNDYQTLSSIEDGSRKLKATELARLAKIYLRDISYFLTPRQEEANVVVLWRAYSGDNACKLKEQEFVKYCDNYYDLEERLGLDHRFSLPQLDNLTADDFNYEKIREIATEYYNQMLLGSRPACVLEKVLEEKYNIKILYLDLGRSGSAASAIGKFGAAILTNANEVSWRKNFNIAHELFHIITWKIFDYKRIHVDDNAKPLIEKWADAFASNLLLPQEEITREFENRIKDGKISLLDLIGIAREFIVSIDAFLWRLVTLKLIGHNEAKELLESNKVRELDTIKRLADHKEAMPCISIRYLNLAFKAYQNGFISRGKLAEYLNIDRNDVGKMLRQYGGYAEEETYNEELAVA
jgi:Zn-dependent peptidase ImmA (M78 family)/DNA-binding XRE family transcriptional regulator